MTAGSAMVAEPVSGIAGIGALVSGRGINGATQSISDAQQAMTYQPRTEAGRQGLQGLQQFMQPIGDVIQGASQNLGDKTYAATGSPTLAAAAYSAPTALMEGLGLKGLNIARKPVSGADLYSARTGMGKIDNSDPVTSAVYAKRESFFNDDGEFDLEAYRGAEYDAEDLVDQSTYDGWQNANWEESSKARISSADASRIIDKVKSSTLFHGSPYEFDDINLPDDGGAFLTGSMDSAAHYAGGGNIYKYRINPSKPFFVRSSDATYDIEQSGELSSLKAKGYDSIIPLDGGDYVVLNKKILEKVQ
jgi:hypothetical protein